MLAGAWARLGSHEGLLKRGGTGLFPPYWKAAPLKHPRQAHRTPSYGRGRNSPWLGTKRPKAAASIPSQEPGSAPTPGAWGWAQAKASPHRVPIPPAGPGLLAAGALRVPGCPPQPAWLHRHPGVQGLLLRAAPGVSTALTAAGPARVGQRSPLPLRCCAPQLSHSAVAFWLEALYCSLCPAPPSCPAAPICTEESPSCPLLRCPCSRASPAAARAAPQGRGSRTPVGPGM